MSYIVLMHQNETTCLTLFWFVWMRPRLSLFWCIGMRPQVSCCSDLSGWDHVSHCSDASEWDHRSHILMHWDETTSHILMHWNETTCLTFWCIRMRPCLTLFWCIGMRPHVWHSDASRWDHISHSDAPEWDHMSHVVLMCQNETTSHILLHRDETTSHILMYRNETTCLTLFWCVGMRPHVSHSDVSGWDHMSHILMCWDETTCLTSQPPPLSYCAHHRQALSVMMWAFNTFVLCGVRPSCNDYCTLCFQNAFVVFTLYALAFYVFLGYAVL